MSYQSAKFLLFSGAVLAVYYLAGRKYQKWVLLAANLAFYLIAGVSYLPFLLAVVLASFFSAAKMSAVYAESEKELLRCTDGAGKKAVRARAKARAKRWLLFALILALGMLAVFKYTLFTLQNVNRLLPLLNLPKIALFPVLLPLGISFYTFMAVSYLLDVYWRRYEAERNFVVFAAYLTYFPHIVEGPIDRFDHLRPKIADGVAFSGKNLAFGAELALWGFFKKLVIADRLNVFVGTIYDGETQYTGLLFIIATVLYSVQIYADFSGCIDIVSGISEMFGIRLDPNFNHPYFSRTMPEFWRRWHISLMEWFKDYIYFPVSASALVKKAKKHFRAKNNKRGEELAASCIPALVVWLITGLWHGAAWKFAAWGLYHAALIIGGTVCAASLARLTERLGINTENFSWKLWQVLRTFFLCCVGRVFFRASSLTAAFDIFRRTFQGVGLSGILKDQIYTYGLDRANFGIAAAAMLVLLVADLLQEKMCIREALAKQNTLFRWCVIYAGFFAVVIFGMYGPGFRAEDFIYGQF